MYTKHMLNTRNYLVPLFTIVYSVITRRSLYMKLNIFKVLIAVSGKLYTFFCNLAAVFFVVVNELNNYLFKFLK